MDADYFRDLYAKGDGDPWRFATSDYERRKYEATLSALPRARYARGLEIGCSIGVLTRMLAQRCETLLATEPVERALVQARTRCADLHNVDFRLAQAPHDWPAGQFDLIVLSEVIYYLTREQVRDLADRVAASLASDGDVILVHWIRETDYPLSGDDAVHAFLDAAPFLSTIRQERTADYRLDVCRRAGSMLSQAGAGSYEPR